MDSQEYTKFADEIYTERYFKGVDAGRANYVSGFDGSWYDEVVKWLGSAIPIRNKVILDGGCAVGSLMNAMLKLGAKYVSGVDYSLFACNTAYDNLMSRYDESQFQILNGDLASVASLLQMSYMGDDEFNVRIFDTVITTEVIEHLNPDSNEMFASNISDIIKKGGIVYLQGQFDWGNPRPENDDPGHINRQTAKYWTNLFYSYNFKLRTDLMGHLMYKMTPMVKGYNWDFLVFEAE